MLSYTEENYLKAIYSITKGLDEGAATTKISELLSTRASSATDMIKRLSEKGLVNYKKYQGAKLTPDGLQTALKVIRKHRLWEVFLVDKLQFRWDEVHDIAEQLEHIQSSELTKRLDAFLGFPEYDPHGDPIPKADGSYPQDKRVELIHCPVGLKGTIQGVKDDSTAFLKYLEKVGIELGSEVKIISVYDFDQSMEVEINGKAIQLSKKVCNNLYFKGS